MKLGIVPAGGTASRFGGVFKELLPVTNGYSALWNCVKSLSFCDKIIILTTPAKVSTHMSVLRGCGKVVFSVSDDTLWSSVRLTFPFGAERSYFVMPDTYFSPVSFPERGDFEMLLFKTNNAKKYGILVGDCIHDKEDREGEYLAWGALSWTKRVVDHWKDKIYFDHTDAMNDAIRTFGYMTGLMEYYYDFATMDDYVQWLTQH